MGIEIKVVHSVNADLNCGQCETLSSKCAEPVTLMDRVPLMDDSLEMTRCHTGASRGYVECQVCAMWTTSSWTAIYFFYTKHHGNIPTATP